MGDLVTSIENKYGNTTISKYDYFNDDLGRRTAMGKSGTAFNQADTIAYGYDDKSRVTSAVATNHGHRGHTYDLTIMEVCRDNLPLLIEVIFKL